MVSRKQYLCLNCKAHGFEIGKKGHDCSIYLNCPHRCKVCKDVRVAHLASRINYKIRQQIDIRNVKKSFDCGVQAAKRRLAAREALRFQNKPKEPLKKTHGSSGGYQNSNIRDGHAHHSFQTSTNRTHEGCSSRGFQTSTNQKAKSDHQTTKIRIINANLQKCSLFSDALQDRHLVFLMNVLTKFVKGVLINLEK